MKFAAVLGAALFLLAAPGCGDDSADVAACEGKSRGDACTDGEGQEGVCAIDGDTDTLECEDTVP